MNKDQPDKLPQFAIWLLKAIARPDDFYYAAGDLSQIYASILRHKSPIVAWMWFWWEILRSLPGFMRNTIYWSIVMFKNYLKITGRNIKKQFGYFTITIAGLAVGMACSLLIMLWVQHELSFDSFHQNADRIYRPYLDVHFGTPIRVPVSSAPMGPAMVEEFPEIAATVRFSGDSRIAVTVGESEYFEDDVTFAENSLFQVFDFSMIRGDPMTALEEPFTTVLSESTARKYFGDADPIGQIIRFNGRDDYTVTGVFRDIPSNSHITFDIVRSHQTLVSTGSDYLNDWFDFNTTTYLIFEEGVDYHAVEQKMDDFANRHFGDLLAMGGSMKIYFQPLKDIYLHSDFGQDYGIVGNMTYVYSFTAVALFVLLIACINFVNLTTARSASRAREVGLRKTFGADRRKLIGQFLGEAVLYCLLAFALALILFELALPAFNNLAGCDISLEYFTNLELMLGLLGGAVLIGLLAGCYPAFYLSAFNPSQTLKKVPVSSKSGSGIRSALVVFQFSISIILIIGTLTIFSQIDFMKNQELGFDGAQVLVLPNVNSAVSNNFDVLLSELERAPGVAGVTASTRIPGRGISKSIYFPEGQMDDESQTMNYIGTDHEFLEVLGITLAEGRNFSPEITTDVSEAIIINEAAVRLIGWDEPLGKIIRTSPADDTEPNSVKRVIGVVKDFHQYSLQNPIEPLVIQYEREPLRDVSLKLAGISVTQSIEAIEQIWKQFAPGIPYDYFFLDEDFDRQYRKEVMLSKIVLYFCLLAIFIGCLGLLGMASYAAEQRTKEIGIRKVLGASTSGVVALLTRQFLGLAVISNIVAWPVAYFIMRKWLENFAYRIDLGLGIYAFATLLALTAALGTVVYQAIRAASANPVDSLKCE
ncbi:MAG: ABC transporter permease [candidate division Zixibacteria bacterium]